MASIFKLKRRIIMADINGLVKRRAVLTANTEQTLTFGDGLQSISFSKHGTGTVAYKFDATLASITDDESNFLDDDVFTVSEYERGRFVSISLYADAAMTVQWDI